MEKNKELSLINLNNEITKTKEKIKEDNNKKILKEKELYDSKILESKKNHSNKTNDLKNLINKENKDHNNNLIDLENKKNKDKDNLEKESENKIKEIKKIYELESKVKGDELQNKYKDELSPHAFDYEEEIIIETNEFNLLIDETNNKFNNDKKELFERMTAKKLSAKATLKEELQSIENKINNEFNKLK